MTRNEALATVHRQAAGLAPDLDGTRRLLERVSTSEQAEELRAALVELGAEHVLDQQAEP
jgi:hypothetical protein